MSAKLIDLVSRILTILFFFGFFSVIRAQNIPYPNQNETDSTIFIESISPTDSAIFLIRGDQEIQRLYGNVVLRNDSLFVKCDTATIINSTELTAGGNIIVNRADTLFAYADHLVYSGITGIANFYSDQVIVTSPRISLLALHKMVMDLTKNLVFYESGGQMYNDSILLLSRRGTYFLDTDFAVVNDSVVFEYDGMKLFSDSLSFDRRNMMVHFVAPTRMENGQDILYCESGYYDLNRDRGLFTKNVEFFQDNSLGSADSIIYEGNTNIIRLMGNAEIIDSLDRQISARTIVYDRNHEKVRLLGNGLVLSDEGKVFSNDLIYDLKTEKYESQDKTFVSNEDFILQADKLVSIGEGREGNLASGNVKLEDLENGSLLYAEKVEIYEDKNNFKAYGDRPVFVLLGEENKQDSTFIAADTLSRFVLEDKDTTSIVRGFYNVEIWNTSFSAVCDSLSLHEVDSVITLYKNPIIWSDSSQIWGDTVFLFIENQSMDHAIIRKNSLGLVLTKNPEYQNQISGREMFINFKESEIQDILLVGNAESIYFVEDEEKKYVGANEIKSGRMLILFENEELNKIKFYSEIDGIFHDIDGLDMMSISLEGIENYFNRKPIRTIFDR